MNHVERFRAVMNFQPVDRLPHWEWALWWDKTIDRWKTEGLPAELESVFDISQYFGLDPYYQCWFSTTSDTIEATQHHVKGNVQNTDDYLALRPHLFPSHDQAIKALRPLGEKQARGEVVVWATLEGFFWFPRTLLGVERHIYAFYDQPELMHMINQDLADWHLQLLAKLKETCVPTFMTFGEDMSYNHGPFISKEIFNDFLTPYYNQVLPVLEEMNIIPVVDTDGDVTIMVPWLQEVGLNAILPLERQAGVDAAQLRKDFPTLRMIGHFNKLTMHHGEKAMREEFERLLPTMKTGGFIPSVDHQTPPAVSLTQYRDYLRLLREYTNSN